MTYEPPFGPALSPQAWDEAAAAEALGKTILVGITSKAADGSVAGFDQFFGVIDLADVDQGIRIKLADGTHAWLPPQLDAIFHALEGTYSYRSMGERVENPDLISNWTF
jgi:hypothetical protein